MGIFSRIKEAFTPQEKALPHPTNSSWTGPGFNFQDWANVGMNRSRYSLVRANEDVFSVITRLSNTMASLPVHLYKKYEQEDSGIGDLLNGSANNSMTAFQVINQLEVSRDIDGNGFLFIERDKNTGTPIALWPLDPGTVTIMKENEDGSIWYKVSNETYNFLVFNTEIIHVKHISALYSDRGVSPIDVLNGTLNFDNAVEDFSLSEMRKKDAYIIEYARSLSPEKRQAMIDDFKRMIHENGGAVVQEQGMKYTRYESKFQPSDLSATSEITKKKIANVYNIPLTFLGENAANARTTESVMTQFVQMTLVPIVKQYEAEFNRKLLTRSQRAEGYYFKFNVNSLMRGDTNARTSFYQMMIRNGIATPNDLRKLEDLPVANEPNADKLWFSKDLALLQDADKMNVPPTESNLKGGETNDDNEKENEDESSEVPTNETGS